MLVKYLADHWATYFNILADGSYELDRLETPANGSSQVLRIPYQNDPICLDYRQTTGADSYYTEQNIVLDYFYPAPVAIPPEGCVFISQCQTVRHNDTGGVFHTTRSMLIDSTPDSITYPPHDSFDACLREGDFFQNTDAGIDVSWQTRTVGTATVQINIDQSRLEQEVDIDPFIETSHNFCEFTPGNLFRFSVRGLTEREVNQTFIVSLYGTDSTGNVTKIFSHPVLGLDPGKVKMIEKRTIDNRFQKIRFVVDETNVVSESSETNNEQIISKCSP